MSNQKSIPSYANELIQLVDQLSDLLPEKQFAIFNQDAKQLAQKITQPLKVIKGDTAPDFSLPNATGTIIRSKDLLEKGPVVLTFYRGEWCPYCNLYLKHLQSLISNILPIKISMVAISPQKPDHSLSMKEKNELTFHVLSDIGNIVAKQFTSVFINDEKALGAMADLGYDFDGFYADGSRELPVPATFIIEQNGMISFAQSSGGDYRKRVEISEIVSSLSVLK